MQAPNVEVSCGMMKLQETYGRLARRVDRFVMCFKQWKHRRAYAYGRIHRKEDDWEKDNVRLVNKTGKVEFILWNKGEQGHEEDYWHEMGCGWEDHFIPDT